MINFVVGAGAGATWDFIGEAGSRNSEISVKFKQLNIGSRGRSKILNRDESGMAYKLENSCS